LRWKRLLHSLKEQMTSFSMHIDSCPRCGAPGYVVRKFVKGHGPYPIVQHYDHKSEKGTTRVRQCFISLKKLHPSEEDRINKLLAPEKARKERKR